MSFAGHVASVSQVLAKSSTHLDNTLGTLNQALIDVKGFLQQNNSTLIGTVDKLTDLTQVLSDQSEDIEQVLHVAGPGIANFYNIYDPAQGTLNGLISIPEFANPVQFICGGSFDTAAGLSGTGVLQARRDLPRAVGPATAPADVQLPADHVPPAQHDHRVQGPDPIRHPGNPGQVADTHSGPALDTGARRASAQPGGPAGADGSAGIDQRPGTRRARPGAESVRPTAGSRTGCPGAPVALAGRAGGRAMRRIWLRGGALAAGSALLAGCQFGGLNSVALPGTAGHGPGSYSITVDLADVATLPQNSPVMVDDVTVGSVSGIDAMQRSDGSFYAAVKLTLDRNVVLPANSIARVAQTSLLGSQHVELAAPPNQPPVGRLVDGSAIQEARTSRFPTTEEVFSALGVVVNKGNLGALQEITDETYQAVAGREGQFTNLVPRLAELTAGLNNQVNDIVAAIDGLDRFSTILANNKDSLGRTLETLPEALRVLNKNRDKIVEAFGALKKVATVAAHVLSQTKVDFAADLKDIYANTKALADNRKNFVTSMQLLLTFPFPNFGIKQAVRGDYLNVFTTFDLTVRRLGETFFTTSWPLDPNMLHMKDILNPPDFLLGEMANLSGQAADPFKIPPGTPAGNN